jgi:hypothetical protein
VLRSPLQRFNSGLSTQDFLVYKGQILKWPTRRDCKSLDVSLRRFESFSAHILPLLEDVLAHVAQLVEHVLGKDEVVGSIPIVSSSHSLWIASAVFIISRQSTRIFVQLRQLFSKLYVPLCQIPIIAITA